MANKKPIYATNINHLRMQLRLTRKEAAKLAGINERTWGSYEEGRAFPNWKKLPQICRVLQFNDILQLIKIDLTVNPPKPNVQITFDTEEALQALEKIKYDIDKLKDYVHLH